MVLMTSCLMLTSHAFQTINRPLAPYSTSSESITTLHGVGRKGNRGGQNKISENTSKRTRPQVNDVLDGINELPEFPHSVDPNDLPPGSVNADPLAPLIEAIVHAADMRKASDIVAMRVTQCTSLTNFVVIVSGTSRPQNQAIASAIAKDIEDDFDGKRCLGKGVPEGTADSGWILLDYGEVMVHVMTPKSRLFYDMDGQWRERGGQDMDLSHVLVDEFGDDGTGGVLGGDDGLSMKEQLDVEKEDDPFWS